MEATVEEYPRYARLAEAGRPTGFSYYYPVLLAYQRRNRRVVYLGEDDGSLCVYRWQKIDDKARLDLYLAPTPMNPAVLRRCLERINDYNGDTAGRVMRIDDTDADAVAGAGMRVVARREQYLFKPADFDDLGGSRLRTVRRNVAAIEKLPDVELRPYRPDDAEACTTLLDEWTREHRERHGTSGGRSSARRMIKLAGDLPETVLRGQVILIGGELAGYGFGGGIHSELGCFHEAKCRSDVKGLTYYQRRSFLSSLRDYPLVNDGSDVGRQGLRQIKQSFRPAGMHREHRGYQHG
ncbi:hypothetical protein ABI59_21975 [Acidobacteria bacterium Mor1]|nr:hypothetical protein ABI59_21975 [Acidobacteria bacterium Mor1]